ncbi:MAG: DUF3108 domain-containing protein [Pseudomonadota bacterium]
MLLAAPGSAAVPPGRLLVLAAAVLALHLMLLQAAPGPVSLDEPLATRQFITRTIEINRPAAELPAGAPAPVPEPAPLPAPVPQARPRAAQAEPLSTPPAAPAAEPVPAPPRAAADMPPSPAAAASSPPLPAPAAEAAAPAPREPGPRATAFSIPGSVKLLYNVTGEIKKQAWNARGELLWRHDGSSYQARSEVSAFLAGTRTQTSAGRITPEGLAPARFSDKSKTELAAHFERDRGRIIFSANTPEAPLLTGAQDRLSVFLQLGAMIAGEPSRFPPAATISVQTAGPRDADTWLFTVEGEEKLALVNGEMAALKLMRNPRRDFDMKVELWLAPALGYLPVRTRLTQQNGDFVDQQLRSTDKP